MVHVINAIQLGGAERILLELLPGIRNAGADIRLVTLKGARSGLAEQLVDAGVEVHTVGLDGLGTIANCLALPRRIDEFEPHVVHTHLSISDVVGGVAARLAGCPVILSSVYNDGYWMRAADRLLDRRIRPIFRCSVAVSHATRRAMVSRGARADRIVVLPHSTVKEHVGRAPHSGVPHESGTNGPVLCTVGRLVPIKATIDLLRVAATLRPRYPGLRVWIVGRGPEKRNLESAIGSMALGAGVAFADEGDDAMTRVAQADVFVLTSLSEGLPMVVVEAMALSKPIVATNVGGVPELIEDGVSGLLAPPGDIAGIADAVSRILDNPALGAKLGASARTAYLRSWTVERMIDAYIRFYEEILSGEVSTHR